MNTEPSINSIPNSIPINISVSYNDFQNVVNSYNNLLILHNTLVLKYNELITKKNKK
jgi:hypothetical protein